MKRRDLIHHLEHYGSELVREGSKFMSTAPLRKSPTVPRHREIDEYLARKICKDLQVPEP